MFTRHGLVILTGPARGAYYRDSCTLSISPAVVLADNGGGAGRADAVRGSVAWGGKNIRGRYGTVMAFRIVRWEAERVPVSTWFTMAPPIHNPSPIVSLFLDSKQAISRHSRNCGHSMRL